MLENRRVPGFFSKYDTMGKWTRGLLSILPIPCLHQLVVQLLVQYMGEVGMNICLNCMPQTHCGFNRNKME